MRVKLLANLKVGMNDIQTIGRIFDDNFDAFPEWLQMEIKRKKYIEVLPDIAKPEKKKPEKKKSEPKKAEKKKTPKKIEPKPSKKKVLKRR